VDAARHGNGIGNSYVVFASFGAFDGVIDDERVDATAREQALVS
jgi:hypothetical protein